MNKLLDFFKKYRKMIFLSMIAIMALVLITCFISKYFSFLLIILLGVWLFWNPAPQTNQSEYQEDWGYVQSKAKLVSEHIMAVLNENKNMLCVAPNYDFTETFLNGNNICTEFRFVAPSNIGRATVHIDEINKKSDEIQRMIFQKITNALKRRTYNTDVSLYVKTCVSIKQFCNDAFYSIEVQVLINNDFYKYYLAR